MSEIEVPTDHLHETIKEIAEKKEAPHSDKLIISISLSSAIIAVLAAITALFAGHFSNEALINQIKASDTWAFYQAKSIKSTILTTKQELLEANRIKPNKKDLTKINDYEKGKNELQTKATHLENESKAFLIRHIKLAKGVSIFQIAIAIGAISALTRNRWLWYGSILLSIAGIYFLIRGTM